MKEDWFKALTVWELQQHSPLKLSARGVLQANSRCLSGMLTLTHPVQLVPRTDNAWNAPWPPHIHLHWWQTRMQPTMRQRHQSHGQQQWWTSRPHQQTCRQRARAYGMEVSPEKSTIMTNSTNNIKADISMKGQKLELVTTFRYLGATLSKGGTGSAVVQGLFFSTGYKEGNHWPRMKHTKFQRHQIST